MDRKGLGNIANVGAEIAAGSFYQGVDKLRHLVWESPLSKAVRHTLELCPPSLTHLFGDDARIKEALEAERRRPYQASSFRSKPAFQPRSNKSKSWTAKKSKPARRGQVLQLRGKRPRPSLQEGGGPEEPVSPPREAGEVPGLESPALTPLPASTPF
jgi:hypothetical protein